MSLFVADIKDGGTGSFIFDISRFIAATYSIDRVGLDQKELTDTMFSAYLSGLGGKHFEPNKKLDFILDTTVSDYETKLKKYVDKKTVYNRFIFSKGEIEPIRFQHTDPLRYARLADQMNRAISEMNPELTVTDFAFRPRDRGSRTIRYWALVIDASGEKSIIEFKEALVPALSFFEPQLPMEPRYEAVRNAFWGKDDSSYKLVTLETSVFWMRPKKISVFDIPYGQKSKKEHDLLLALVEWESYEYGRWIAKQDPGNSYVNYLSKNKDEILRSIRRFTNDYLDRLEGLVEDAQGEVHD